MAEMVLTQNFKTWLNYFVLGTDGITDNSSSGNNYTSVINAFNSSVEPRFKTSFKNTDGEEKSLCTQYASSRRKVSVFSSLNNIPANNAVGEKTQIRVGSGLSQPTETDYNLNQPYTSNTDYNTSNVAHYLTNQNGKSVMVVHSTITAITALSVNEIGLMLSAPTSATSSSTVWGDFLFGRCVLDEPVTLAAGESKTFELVVSLF